MRTDRSRGAAAATIASIVALVMSVLGPSASSAAPPGPYFNGFENSGDAVSPPDGSTEAMFDVTRVPSGTGGITSAAGSWHAEAALNDYETGTLSPFTRLGGYSGVFPAGGYTTSVDIYLDTAASPPGSDLRFDWSSAINDTSGSHRRDFIFSVGTDGSGGFVMSASNNAPGWPANPARDPFTITTSGWYTFEHVFRDDGSGVLAVDMRVLSGTTILHTWTLSNPSDVIGSTVGGNRYAWLVYSDFATLALDNVTRSGECTTVCYVDAVNGNDTFDGVTPATAKATIQAALNQVAAGGQVRVLPGIYDEVAPGSAPTSLPGTYQFGLFFHSSKPGITLMGVTAGDDPITDPSVTEATINTDATNNFGYSGIFVEAPNTTIQGVEIGPNLSGDNKTIEVVADDFTLQYANTDIPNGGGSVYINDFSSGGTVVQSYHVLDNLFDDGTSVDLASGAGNTGPETGREIKGNVFDLMGNGFNAISFSGTGGPPWFENPVGGAIITGNEFSNSTQFIRARGDYHETQFDWQSYWDDNSFPDGAVIDLISEGPPFDVQPYSYTSSPYTFTNVRRIGGTIQGELDHSVDGNTVLVAAGVYPESPNIANSVNLKSDEGPEDTAIDLQTGPTYLGALTIDGDEVTVDGFTIEGRDASCPTLAGSNILLNTAPDTVTIKNNEILVGATDDACANGDDGIGVLSTYSVTSDVDTLVVDGNIFEPLGTAGFRAFYVNPGVNHFTFSDNEITGDFAAPAITQAKDGLVEDNVVLGSGTDPAGLGTWGYPDATIYGHTTFRGNDISSVKRGITVFSTNDVVIEGNEIHDNDVGVRAIDTLGVANYDPSTIDIHLNNITDNSTAGVRNDSTTAGTVDATCNWWDSLTGPTSVLNPAGTGDEVLGDVDFQPWLVAPAPGGPCIGGTWAFQGFFSPVDNPPTLNSARAGQTIPVKWRILDADGAPIDDPSSFVSLTSFQFNCDTLDYEDTDLIETYASTTGLDSKGDGYWQFNWTTSTSYKGKCRTLVLTLGDGSVHTALFQFK